MNARDRDPSGRRSRPDRAERLAAALRANLKRRKAQSRGRAETRTTGDDVEKQADSLPPDRPDR